MIMYKEEVDKKPTREEIIKYIEKEGPTPPTVPFGKQRLTKEMRKKNAKLRDMNEKLAEGPKDLEDMLSLGDVPRKEKQGYQSYSKVKKVERKEIRVKQAIESIEFFKKVLKYCEGNSMKPSFTMESSNLVGEFDKLSEEQLFEVQRLLQFAHDPIDHDPKRRYIVSITEHEIMTRIRNECKNRIPGFDKRVAIANLDNEKTEIEKKRQDLQERLAIEQQKFKEKQERLIKASEPTPTPTPKEDDGFIKCECGKTLRRMNEQHTNSKRHQEWVNSKEGKEWLKLHKKGD